MKSVFFLLVLVAFTFACGSEKPQTVKDVDEQVAQVSSKTFSPESIAVLAKALKAHGGERYEQAHYQFNFRGKTYTFHNNGSEYRYTMSSVKDGVKTEDFLDDGVLKRTIDGEVIELTEKQRNAAQESLNSVIYFATLPHKLTDASVNLAYSGQVRITDSNYDILQVTFDQEGGGVDHDDQYRYWINTESGQIDYLAYNYQTNKGGVRFREAFNPRVVEGILFQDYVNYKAPVGTPLDSLPAILERGELEKLSLIETEDVINLSPFVPPM